MKKMGITFFLVRVYAQDKREKSINYQTISYKVFYVEILSHMLHYFLSITSVAQNKSESRKVTFDSTLAPKPGADEYGMKRYVMTFYRKNQNENPETLHLHKSIEKKSVID